MKIGREASRRAESGLSGVQYGDRRKHAKAVIPVQQSGRPTLASNVRKSRSSLRVCRVSVDGGSEGAIEVDALRLDAVYIQAKRSDPSCKIGPPYLQRFVGSLTGERATKGVS